LKSHRGHQTRIGKHPLPQKRKRRKWKRLGGPERWRWCHLHLKKPPFILHWYQELAFVNKKGSRQVENTNQNGRTVGAAEKNGRVVGKIGRSVYLTGRKNAIRRRNDIKETNGGGKRK